MYSRQGLCVSKIFFQVILQNNNTIFTVILESDSLMNRHKAKHIMKIKFAPRKMHSSKQERLSKWAMGYKGKIPLDWTRPTYLRRKEEREKLRL